MAWLRSVDSLKSQVSFAEYSLFYRALLQKRLVILRSLRIEAPHSTVAQECYGVASIRRLLKIIGLFCKRALQKRRYSPKETYNFKEPTNRSHPIAPVHTHLQSTSCTCMNDICKRYATNVTTISRLLKIIGLFCRIPSLL